MARKYVQYVLFGRDFSFLWRLDSIQMHIFTQTINTFPYQTEYFLLKVKQMLRVILLTSISLSRNNGRKKDDRTFIVSFLHSFNSYDSAMLVSKLKLNICLFHITCMPQRWFYKNLILIPYILWISQLYSQTLAVQSRNESLAANL